MAAASSAAIDSVEKHDVFLSFRGEDTRRGFTSHLYNALDQVKIQAYIDDKLEKGDEIGPALLEAITESKLSVIIFSKNYASSRWCLDELVQILQCRASQFVIPIFYDVDPSVVRQQLGIYADAFDRHSKCFEDYKLKAWREALTTAGNISGFHLNSKEFSTEANLVKGVVKEVLAKLGRRLQIQSGLEGLVGIEKHVKHVESLLYKNPNDDIRIVGIWGMGGIGKSTIADVVFHRLSSQFEACCFIQNGRERSETTQGLYELRDQLLSSLLKEENLHVTTRSIESTMRQRLSRIKALVVLDDVSELNQMEFLTGGDCILFGRGSRIVVTGRNKRMLGADDDKIYEVEQLDCDVALDLFHLRALRNLSPTIDYENLSKEVIDYAGGNPLALTVLGAVFSHCRRKQDWKGELEKLKKYPDRKIQSVLKLSYDALGKNEKDIFLDIACFHRGKYINETKRLLACCGFSVNAGVRLLIDMSLISFDKDTRTLQMHDLIQEMGREIVYDDNNPKKGSRLWLANEQVGPVLEKNRGTKAIECIVLKMDDLSKDLHMNAASFENMDNLRILNIHTRSSNLYYGVNKVHLPPDFEFLPDALTYLRWHFYPLPHLPSRFCSKNLVELRMCNSRLIQLWKKDIKIELGSIKHIDLSWSKNLTEFPFLSNGPKLESINLQECSSLIQLPTSFQHHLNLTHLNLEYCSSLKILPEMPGNVQELLLWGTAIKELPCSIWSLEKLEVLDITTCRTLKNLPSTNCSLNMLRSLDLSECHSLESLAVKLPPGLKILSLRYCRNLRFLPDELPDGLEELDLENCKNLVIGSLPVKLPPNLKKLSLRKCKNLDSLPDELPAGLECLDVEDCQKLSSLPVERPASLRRLFLRGCRKLVLPKWISSSVTLIVDMDDQPGHHLFH